jgi:acyl-[acyl carrier protein]--UDP-N-acetylglucosamine O-acyltransferase
MIREISSFQNDWVKRVKLLQEKNRARRKEGVFIVEGLNEIRLCIAGGYKIVEFAFCPDLISIETLNQKIGANVLDFARVYSLSGAIFDSLAYRGGVENAIALVAYPTKRNSIEDIDSEGLFFVAESVEKPGNLGAILRTADASKMSALIVCDELVDIFHPNVIVYDNCQIGNNVIIHAGTIIGSDAFYFKNRKTHFEQLQTCGNVIIKDNVQIGANCTFDKGVTSDTIIGKGTIIDNLVHVAHDVVIGDMCLFAANVAIAGCCTIGNNVTMWGQVGVSSNISIGDGAVIQAQSGVGENVPAGKTFFGSPAAEARTKMREVFAVKQLPSLIHKLYNK